MKKYEKPVAKEIVFSSEDIIQTSGLIPGEGSNDNPMEWSMRPNSNGNDTTSIHS